MTAEIAILNKTGLALAADSALTVQIGSPKEKEKKLITRFTANKVFALSKHAPVGVMVYYKPEIMGIPWETVIKRYRGRLGRTRFGRLKEYCDDFLEFLGDLPVPDELEAHYVLQGAREIFGQMRKNLDTFVASEIKRKGEVAEPGVEGKLREIIGGTARGFADMVKQTPYSEQERDRLVSMYGERIVDVAKNVFEERPLTTEDMSLLRNIVVNAACIGKPKQSGVVIAGFGEDELYPSFFDYNIPGVLLGKAVQKLALFDTVTDKHPAIIKAFAQAEDVVMFIEGMGTSAQKLLSTALSSTLQKTLPERLMEAVKEELETDESTADRLLAIAKQMGKGAYDKIMHELDMLRQREYVEPVLRATMFLQKAELGVMAETLVNLVSFRKQVTLAEETVGGPIDVAVITKGDGLVWIKRKHYFRAELNPQFFRNYFEEGENRAK